MIARLNDSSKLNITHIRYQYNIKCTVINGLYINEDIKKMSIILKGLKKELNCGGSLKYNIQYGNIIQLQGDHRKDVTKHLLKYGFIQKDEYIVHGL